MRPVYQTAFGPDGNCLTAAVASILELPLEAVPALIDAETSDEDWWVEANRRLASLGYGLACLPPDVTPRGCALLFGDGGRGYNHVVVAEDGRLAHDPTPGGSGIAGPPLGWFVLVPLAGGEGCR